VSLTPPFLLLDRYDVSAQIGRGGHAVVYRAHDRVSDFLPARA
jgi:serine/threonine protein kinase